jgi:hypothetical protein
MSVPRQLIRDLERCLCECSDLDLQGIQQSFRNAADSQIPASASMLFKVLAEIASSEERRRQRILNQLEKDFLADLEGRRDPSPGSP